MAKKPHDVKVVVRDPSSRQQLVQFLLLLSLPALIYTSHGMDFDGFGCMCRSHELFDVNLEFDFGRTTCTCMQLEVFAQERQRRQTVTTSFLSNEEVIIAFTFAAPPP